MITSIQINQTFCLIQKDIPDTWTEVVGDLEVVAVPGEMKAQHQWGVLYLTEKIIDEDDQSKILILTHFIETSETTEFSLHETWIVKDVGIPNWAPFVVDTDDGSQTLKVSVVVAMVVAGAYDDLHLSVMAVAAGCKKTFGVDEVEVAVKNDEGVLEDQEVETTVVEMPGSFANSDVPQAAAGSEEDMKTQAETED